MVRSLPAEYPGVEICIAQPVVVVDSASLGRAILASTFHLVNSFTRAIPNIRRGELSAAVLDLAVKVLDKEVVKNNELFRISQAALKHKDKP